MQKHSGTIIIAPRITEKGAFVAEQGCYVFNVAMNATKNEIAHAIETIYNVAPRKVTLVAVPGKTVRTRGSNRPGRTNAGKKAYVFLKAGETIEVA